MNNREKIIRAIEKAKKQSEEYAQDTIIVPFKEADMILALLKEHENYDRGYQQALNDINKPKKPIMEYCEYSKCPTCDKPFIDFENCNYDLIERAKFMDRCPYCGQALKWPST